MDLRRSGRRHAVLGAGAATLTAAALVIAPATAAADPADPMPLDEVSQAAQDAVDRAVQAAQDAADEATEAARAAQDAADEATRAAEEAAASATEAAEDAAADVTDAATDGTGWTDRLPQELQDDLAALQDLPADERAEEVQRILDGAVAGEYGAEVQDRAQRAVALLQTLPEDLRTDLQGIMGMPPEAARAQLQEIWQRALDGGYGQDVQQWATWLQGAFRQWDLGQLMEG